MLEHFIDQKTLIFEECKLDLIVSNGEEKYVRRQSGSRFLHSAVENIYKLRFMNRIEAFHLEGALINNYFEETFFNIF